MSSVCSLGDSLTVCKGGQVMYQLGNRFRYHLTRAVLVQICLTPLPWKPFPSACRERSWTWFMKASWSVSNLVWLLFQPLELPCIVESFLINKWRVACVVGSLIYVLIWYSSFFRHYYMFDWWFSCTCKDRINRADFHQYRQLSKKKFLGGCTHWPSTLSKPSS